MFVAKFYGGVVPAPHPEKGNAEVAELGALVDSLTTVAEDLCGEELWAGPDGRLLARTLGDLGAAARAANTRLNPRDLPAVLRDLFDVAAVRPPWGGHPRVVIYGLLEARMARADLVICGGLVEGVWPGSAAPDPLLPPAVLRHLGVPAAEFRIGLAAHDLAGAMGAPEVVLSWARRDAAGPAIPSRFVLRVLYIAHCARMAQTNQPTNQRTTISINYKDIQADFFEN